MIQVSTIKFIFHVENWIGLSSSAFVPNKRKLVFDIFITYLNLLKKQKHPVKNPYKWKQRYQILSKHIKTYSMENVTAYECSLNVLINCKLNSRIFQYRLCDEFDFYDIKYIQTIFFPGAINRYDIVYSSLRQKFNFLQAS